MIDVRDRNVRTAEHLHARAGQRYGIRAARARHKDPCLLSERAFDLGQ